jgi:hypothetical protein
MSVRTESAFDQPEGTLCRECSADFAELSPSHRVYSIGTRWEFVTVCGSECASRYPEFREWQENEKRGRPDFSELAESLGRGLFGPQG